MKNRITIVCYETFFQVEYGFNEGKRFGCLQYDHDPLGALAMTIALEGLQKECYDAEVVFITPARKSPDANWDATVKRQQEEGV